MRAAMTSTVTTKATTGKGPTGMKSLDLLLVSLSLLLLVVSCGTEYKTANESLLAEKQVLTAESQRLTAENASLLTEKQALTTANETLSAEKQTLTAAIEALLAEKQALTTANETLSAEQQTMTATSEALLAEKQALTTANETLLAENQALTAAKEAFERRQRQEDQEAARASQEEASLREFDRVAYKVQQQFERDFCGFGSDVAAKLIAAGLHFGMEENPRTGQLGYTVTTAESLKWAARWLPSSEYKIIEPGFTKLSNRAAFWINGLTLEIIER